MKTSKSLAYAGVIAACYAALTIALAPIAFGPAQLRISEALTVLPFFTPLAIPGLFIGCVIANLFSPYGPLDVIMGSAATLIAAVMAYIIAKKVKKRVLKLALIPLCAPISNGLIIGAMLTFLTGEAGSAIKFFVIGGQIFVEELIVCYFLGLPLIFAVEKILARKNKPTVTAD